RAEEERRKSEQKNSGKPPVIPQNLPVAPSKIIVPGDYQIYDGRNIDKAPEILNTGGIIAPFFYIAQKRINAKSKKDIGLWADKWYDTSDLILYNDKNNKEDVKIMLAYDAKYNLTSSGKKCLELINPTQTLVNGGVNISGLYSDVDGEGVISTTRNELAQVLETGLSKAQAKDSKLWRMLLRHPDEVGAEFAVPGLHEEYIDWVYSAYGSRFAKGQNVDDLELMGVYLASPQDVPQLRAWCVNRLEGRSNAYGWNDLDYGDGCFAGISARGAGQKK
ncbi:MAG: hypothetical protein Q8N63_03610, partial [Nanoarchaeota archaeon]|nr:hypothetical protein [Nanoarchaeota archaeon]